MYDHSFSTLLTPEGPTGDLCTISPIEYDHSFPHCSHSVAGLWERDLRGKRVYGGRECHSSRCTSVTVWSGQIARQVVCGNPQNHAAVHSDEAEQFSDRGDQVNSETGYQQVS